MGDEFPRGRSVEAEISRIRRLMKVEIFKERFMVSFVFFFSITKFRITYLRSSFYCMLCR